MKKIEKLEKIFENDKNFSEDTILFFFALHLFCVLFSIGLVYELKYALINIPYVILSSSVYIVFYRKKERIKYKDKKLFLGIIMIIASFQCQIMSAFFVPMKTNQIISLEIVFFITNFLVFVLLTIAIIIRINSKKEFSKAQYASFPFIVVSSALGIQLSRYFVGNKDKIIFVIAFILMSYIFSAISSLFSLDWYYMTLLEKTKKSEHKKTGDG